VDRARSRLQSLAGCRKRLLGITKRGDKYLRKLLVHGARSITTRAERTPQPPARWLNKLRERRGKPRSYRAQANNTARIAWAIMAKGVILPLLSSPERSGKCTAAGGAVRISRNGNRARTSMQLAKESSGPCLSIGQ
jgi:hypothetical protein